MNQIHEPQTVSVPTTRALRLLTQIQSLFEPPSSWNTSLPRLAALLGEYWSASSVRVVLSPPDGGFLRESWGGEGPSEGRVLEAAIRRGSVVWGRITLRWRGRSVPNATIEAGWLTVVAGVVAEECQNAWGCEADPNLAPPSLVPGTSLEAHLSSIEKAYLVRTLVETRGNMTEAARRLGLTKRMILLRMEKFGLQYQEFRRRAPN